MKKFAAPVLVLLATAGFIACQKENRNDIVNLNASKTSSIKKNEPVVFSINAPAGSTVVWSVTPPAGVTIYDSANLATILFSNPGNYTVSAVAGGQTATRLINVIDSSFQDTTGGGGSGGGGDTTLPLTGDSVILTMSKRTDSTGGSSLMINAITYNSYNCLNNQLLTSANSSSGNYAVDFNGVFVPGTANCTPGTKKAGSVITFSGIPDGTHNFKVKLNGVTYSGSFTKTGSSYSFTWPVSPGVTLSPLTF